MIIIQKSTTKRAIDGSLLSLQSYDLQNPAGHSNHDHPKSDVNPENYKELEGALFGVMEAKEASRKVLQELLDFDCNKKDFTKFEAIMDDVYKLNDKFEDLPYTKPSIKK